jgi:predicted acylesterase/phospholipase RssA
MKQFLSGLLRFISQLFKSIWLFFPGIIFLLFGIFCFWTLGQGKDIIVAFTENTSRTILSLNYTRIIFFVAIGFWVYVSWYSARIISYIKKKREEDDIKIVSGVSSKTVENEYNTRPAFLEIDSNFLDELPRIIGNSCFLVLELSVLQSPASLHTITSTAAWVSFIVLLIIIRYLNKWVNDKLAMKSSFRKLFYVLLFMLIALIIIISVFPKIYILTLFGLLVLFHVVFIFYTNLRRVQMEKKEQKKMLAQNQTQKAPNLFERLMDYFCIPRKETGYFESFLIIGFAGIILYIASIKWLPFARNIGPFPFIILAFGVLLAFGNIVSAFSVKYKVNFHFILFILAFILGFGETHYVRTIDLPTNNNYVSRPDLRTYLATWIKSRNVAAFPDSMNYDMFFVMSNGGASRSGYWTAGVLGRLEDASLTYNKSNRFSDHVFCVSGTSGGGVGVATFFSLLKDKESHMEPLYAKSAKAFLKQDYFTYTFARMLGPDFFNYIFHVSAAKDRAAALESSFEESSRNSDDSTYQVPFYDTLSKFTAIRDGRIYLPILFVNTTRMQDGNPGVVTNLKPDSGIYNERVDVLNLLDGNKDISLTSGAILGARFPYLSPAGRIANNYFVDGGYFDNSGAGVIQETIRGILNIEKEDSMANGTLYPQIKKLRFTILHIVNSPVEKDSRDIVPVAPIKNDLMSPILTIEGAYDMQTTVNDVRLINYISDINRFGGHHANYNRISLYEDSAEWSHDPLRARFDKEPSYAMNWFMSDTLLRRIDNRLIQNPQLNYLINYFQKNKP